MQAPHIAVCPLVFLSLAVPAIAEPAAQATPDLKMSPELRQLFQAEMRELLTGAQAIAAFLPTANWDGIAKTAKTMRESYILEKKLTAAQEEELTRLPDQFKALDQSFHLRADKIENAAMTKDSEAVSFQFSRLLDTCVTCHTSYARAQFPNFGAVVNDAHHP